MMSFWHWYNDHVGRKKPRYLVANRNWRNYDFSAAVCYPTKPTYATLPLPGIQPVLMDENATEITEINWVDGAFASDFLGRELPELFGEIHQDIKKPILLHFQVKYFTGDGALKRRSMATTELQVEWMM